MNADDAPYCAVEWTDRNRVQLMYVIPALAGVLDVLDDTVVIAAVVRDPGAPLAACWFLEWSDVRDVHEAIPGELGFPGWATLLYAAIGACTELGEAERELTVEAVRKARFAALKAAEDDRAVTMKEAHGRHA